MNKEAIKQAKKLAKDGALEQAAGLFERGGDFERALELYLKLKNYLKAGECSLKLGRSEETVSYYNEAGRSDLVAEFYQNRKDYLRAGQFYSRAGNHAKSAEMYETHLQKWPQMENAPGQERTRHPEEIRTIRFAASMHSKAGNYRRAAELYRWIQQYDEQAKNHFLAQEYRLAGEAYMKAGALSDAGRAYSEGGFYTEAAVCYEKDSSWKLAAESAYKAKDYSKSGELYTKSGDPFSAAKVFAEGGDIDRGIKVLTMVPQDHKGYLDAIRHVIELIKTKRYLTPAANRFFRDFMHTQIINDNLDIIFHIAMLYERSGYYERAQELLRYISTTDQVLLDKLSLEYQAKSDEYTISIDYSDILNQDFDAEQRERERERRLKILNQPTPSAMNSSGEPSTQRVSSGGQNPIRISEIREGQTFGDRYTILQRIGSGGMGIVFKAKDLELDELVAIKILTPHQTLDDTAVVRFKQEIKLARQINHPNVIRIYDLGDYNGIKFITMEYFPGEQLKKIIDENGSFSYKQGLDIAIKICSGLIAAHNKGIIHRDIKSQNIMLAIDGTVKVLDFGIAKSRDFKGLTVDGSVLGTPEYISPEAIMQQNVDRRSDIYSLGIVFYEMFTGTLPITGNNIMTIVRKHLNSEFPKPREIQENLSPELEDVIIQCLEREPRNRYQSVNELIADLKILRSILSDESASEEYKTLS